MLIRKGAKVFDQHSGSRKDTGIVTRINRKKDTICIDWKSKYGIGYKYSLKNCEASKTWIFTNPKPTIIINTKHASK